MNIWKNYFELEREQFYASSKTSSVICEKHYLEIYCHLKRAECILKFAMARN